MPFAPITVNTKTFNQAGDGKYMLSTWTFGTPENYFQIKGGSLTKDRKNIVLAVTRVLQKDVTVNGVTERRSLTVQNIYTIPTVGFTSAEADGLQSDVDAFITSTILDRLASGES